MQNRPKMKAVCTGEKPSYANPFAAGLDLRSNNEDLIIYPNNLATRTKNLIRKIIGKEELPYIVDIKSCLSIELPSGMVGLLVARSGLSFNYQIKLINDIGVIDEDYRGYVGIRLINEGRKPYMIKKGDRVAQLVIVPYVQPELIYVDELSQTKRGEGGFGHTGR